MDEEAKGAKATVMSLKIFIEGSFFFGLRCFILAYPGCRRGDTSGLAMLGSVSLGLFSMCGRHSESILPG